MMENLNQSLTYLAGCALKHWSIDVVDLQLIKFRENAVFRVNAASGKRYALRIHRPGYHSQAAINSELEWMAALSTAGLDVPQVVPTANGELLVSQSAENVPEPRIVDLFEWVDGEILRVHLDRAIGANDSAEIVRLFEQVGETMGRLHNHACEWKTPDGFERPAWDLDGFVGERPFWGRFWELELLTAEQRDLMKRVRQRLHDDLVAYGTTSGNFSLIHADLNFDNVMVEGDKVRPIDFDDAGFGWHLFDMSVTLNHLFFDRLEPLATDALVAGYRRARPISDAELENLPLFMTMRSCSYLGWIRDRQEVSEIIERAPKLIENACRAAEAYLAK